MMRISALAICLAFVAAESHAQTIDAGKKPFESRCASCHGADGTGGARGFNIVDVRQPRATSREAVRDLIRTGIPNGGMPAFSISDEELDSIATYVLSLRPSTARTPSTSDAPPGDTAAGERFFSRTGNCAACHMVRGRGGVLGPDLSNIGRDRTPAQIEQALRDPGGARDGRGPFDSAQGRPRGGGAASYKAVTVR